MHNVSKILVIVTTITMIAVSVVQPVVQAGMIETQTALTSQQRSLVLEKTQRYFLEEDVSQTLVGWGVDNQSVISRLTSLTDNELLALSQKIDQAPAGAGALEVAGVVFLVLLLLELVGVTDIFKKL